MTALVLSLLLCLLVGAVLDRALLGAPGQGVIETLGRGLMLGLGAVGTLAILTDGLGLGAGPGAVFGACGLLVLVLARPAWMASARGTGSAPPAPRWSGWQPEAGHVLLLLLAAVGVGFAVHSGWVRPTFQFDATTRWMFKTKVLFFDGTLLGDVSRDPAFGLTHQRYPPLVSYVSHLPGLFSGQFDDRVASAIYPWFPVAMTAVVYGALRRRSGKLCGALGAFWVANLPLLSFIIGPPPGAGAASAMADIPLGLFVVGAGLAVVDALEDRRPRAHLEAGLLLGFAALTKNEGLPFVAALCLGVLVSAPRGRWRRAAGLAALGVGLYALVWGWISLGLPITDEHYPDRLNAAAFQQGLDRLGLILPQLGRELMDFRSWNLTWGAILVLLVAGGRRLWTLPAARALAVAFVVQVASYVLAYVITSWTSPAAEIISEANEGDPVSVLMNLTMGRLLMQVAPLAVVLALCVSPLEPRPAPAPAGAPEPPPEPTPGPAPEPGRSG